MNSTLGRCAAGAAALVFLGMTACQNRSPVPTTGADVRLGPNLVDNGSFESGGGTPDASFARMRAMTGDWRWSLVRWAWTALWWTGSGWSCR